MHQLFHSVVGNTDLAVLREQANVRTKPDNKYSREPDESVIHYHRYTEPCTPAGQHEFYAVPPLTPEEVAGAFWAAKYHPSIVEESGNVR